MLQVDRPDPGIERVVDGLELGDERSQLHDLDPSLMQPGQHGALAAAELGELGDETLDSCRPSFPVVSLTCRTTGATAPM